MLHAIHPLWLQRVVAILILLTLAACGNAPRVDVQSSVDSTARDARLDAPSTLDPTTLCANLREPLAITLDAEVAQSAIRFRDLVAGVEREGCVLTAKGDGTQFSDFLTVSQQVATMLAERGWSEATPLADGPTGTVLGFTHEQQVAQLTVDWQPAPGVICPLDQPIGDCKLAPAQRLYTIRQELASVQSSAVSALDSEAL